MLANPRPTFLGPLLLALTVMASVPAALAQTAAPAAPATPAALVTQVEGISEYRLDNGLQVLLVPDGSKPTTTVNLTYHVGSRHENYGETGMAHLLEHLMFKGTPQHPNVWSEFTARGLRANGTTSFDRTNYFASYAANDDNLNWYLGWLADAMVNSYIAKKDLDSEMTVVRNEMEMGENEPSRILWQRALGSLFQWHNYGKPTIGARSDVENVDIRRLQAFYRLHYQPDNATLIVAGTFRPDQVLARVQETFGRIPKPTRVLPSQYTLEPVQDGERAFAVRRAGGVPLLVAGYHVPAAGHPDYAAIELLALVLADEPAGRLYKSLVQKRLAAGVWGFAWDLHDPGVMLYGAQLGAGQDPGPARLALLETLESLGREPITAEELERARTRWVNEWNRRFTDPERVGVSLSDSVGQGDWRLFFLLRDRVRSAKLEDVQRVATQYLLRSNRVLGEYVPGAGPERAPALERVDVEAALQGYQGDTGSAEAEAFDPTPDTIEARTQRFRLAGGLQAALLPKGTRGNAVQARIALHYGDAKSLAGSGETPAMVAALLDRGTATLTRQQIEDRFAELNAQVRFAGGSTQLGIGITTVREQLPATIEFIGQLLKEANFPPDALEEIRAQALAGLESQREEPEAVVGNALDRHGDPYPVGDVRHARSFDEQAADLKAVTIERVRDFHRRFYGASHAEFAASGDMDAAAVRQALERAFGGWASTAPYERVPTPLVPVEPQVFTLRTPDKQNAMMEVRLALPITDTAPDYAALMLANRMLGQGGSSRLWVRIREQGGLSYSVHTFVDWSSYEPNSPWRAMAIFAPQNRAKVETAFREEIARALKDGFEQRELDEAKRGLLAARRLARSQDTNLASALAYNLELGRSFLVSKETDAAIANASLEQVNAVLRNYLKPDRFVYGFGGDFKP